MSKLIWDKSGERFWETGVSKGILFPMNPDGSYAKGVVWNGLVNVTQSPTGAEASAIYADNIKYLSLMSVEELEASIEAYTYPDEFAECDGSMQLVLGAKIGQQARKKFALVYQTNIGNDVNAELGYKLHIIYGCMAGPSEKSNDTVNDSPEAMTFSWDITTTPVDVVGFKPTASLEIDSRTANAAALLVLLDNLYGVDNGADSHLTLPAEVVSILSGVQPYLPALGSVVLTNVTRQLTQAPFPAAVDVYQDGVKLVLGAGAGLYTYVNTTGVITFGTAPGAAVIRINATV